MKDYLAKIAGLKFVHDTGLLTITNIAIASMNFIQSILIARWLGPELYGLAILIISYPSFLFSLFDARSKEASVKFVGKFAVSKEPNKVLAMCKLGYMIDMSIALVTLLFVVLTGWFAESYIIKKQGTMFLMLIYAASFIPRSFVNTSWSVLSIHGKYKLISIGDLLSTITRVAIILGFVLSGYGVAGIIFGNAIGMTVSGILFIVITYPLVKDKWGNSWIYANVRVLKGYKKDIAKFLFHNELTELSGLITKQLDVIILGYFTGQKEVGYYRIAKSIGGVIGIPIAPLQSVLYQRMVAISGNLSRLREITKNAFIQIGLPFGLISLFYIFILPYLTVSFLGQSYRPAIPAAQIWVVGYAVWFLFVWQRPIYFTVGLTFQWFGLNFITNILFLVTGLFLLLNTTGFVGYTAARVLIPVIVIRIGGFFMLLYFTQRLSTSLGLTTDSKGDLERK